MIKQSQKLFLLLAALLVANFSANAQQSPQAQIQTAQQSVAKSQFVQTRELDSKLMRRKMPYAVILPASYDADKTKRFPVLYLLHGLTGHYSDWARSGELVNSIANEHKFIAVLVEGENGWYVDGATKPDDKYESYIVEELIPEIDRNFRTTNAKAARAVAGLSMGGFGSLKFALKYPDKFQFAGSMSGALGAAGYSTGLMTSSWGLIKTSLETAFGAEGSDARKNNDIFELARKLSPEQKQNLPFLYLDCGTEDFLIGDNRNFAALLLEKKIPHEFRQLPGAHNWQYWNKQAAEILRLLDKTFAQKSGTASAAAR